jgi:coproporphyrinogen III oxidase
MAEIELTALSGFLTDLQQRICAALEGEDGSARFQGQDLAIPGGGSSRPRALADGKVIEKAAVHFTHALGPQLPPSATARRPELAGRPFEAVSLSLIVHPRNPYAPTSHMNVRCFVARAAQTEPAWWIGGGFDLTPFYGFVEDAIHWHRTAERACRPFGADLYPRFKKACDEYFFLPHRGEPRGIGGIFFDDFAEGGFERCSALLRSVGEHYLPAYVPILARRKDQPYSERERAFQLYRRGRYAEFNLAIDRGTRYGIESGRRIESVLASLPPLAAWRYDWHPDPGSPEVELYEQFLRPRDWLDLEGAGASGS